MGHSVSVPTKSGAARGPVFIAIVNYRTSSLVLECLRSLVPEIATLRGGRVIVVDNDSGDDSSTFIEAAIASEGWSNWAEVVALPCNGGFAYGNNRAIERAMAYESAFSAVICLNPDAAIRPNAITTLVTHLETQEDAGIAGASIEDESGVEQRSAHRFPSPLGELKGAAQLGLLSRLISRGNERPPETGDPKRCDWVSGACFAIRREVLEEIGLLDEGYFLYFEETDFCLRAHRAGWSCWLVPGARVLHREGSATGIRDPRRRRPGYWFDSRRRYFLKSRGAWGLVAADLLWAAGRASLLMRRAVGLGGKPKEDPEPVHFARDLLVGDARALLARLRGDGASLGNQVQTRE